MNDTHDVISAFLDDEPFDASELAEALKEAGGRDLLIDLIALRHLTRAEGKETPVLFERTATRSPLRALVAVAAVLVALVGGYLVGERRVERAPSAPPPATRVVQASATWQELPLGRMR